MSGFEAAGIVLGSIPLIISALEHYQSGLQKFSIWRNYTKVLADLEIQLETEHSVLQNTCESLLSGMVSSRTSEAMISNPFGEEWRSPMIKDQLYWKLDVSVDIFEKNVQQMKMVIERLQRELEAHVQRVCST